MLALVGLLVAVTVLGAAVYVKRGLVLSYLPTPPVVVSDRDFGKVVHVLQGQRLAVKLAGNAQSGSAWRQGIVPPFLEFAEATFQPNSPAATPGDGVQTTTFRVIDAGQGPLFLNYTDQADQNSIKPARTFSIVVVSH